MNITRLSDLQAAVEMTAYARYLAAHAIGVKKRLFDKLTVARYLEITGSTD
ncbi:hypothetical protein [Bacillus cereus group sp. BfR-BA-01352]|uniref:hypothetical protein n=1 Tax=Bacillus cereus group sp. BfR-BA-01352 TaxID=2920315 RepID=UPI001F55F0E9|nr:hypothetical protein [Bacillus cereus group sp. BfR-BA-01352]